MIRKLLKYLSIFAVIFLAFVAILFWSGIWGIYCVPPSETYPQGATWVITRAEDEPLLDYERTPEEAIQEAARLSEEGKERIKKIKRPPGARVVFRFGFNEWLYNEAKKQPD